MLAVNLYWSRSDSKFPQISRTLQSILAIESPSFPGSLVLLPASLGLFYAL